MKIPYRGYRFDDFKINIFSNKNAVNIMFTAFFLCISIDINR